MKLRVLVFCSSSDKVSPMFFSEMRKFGEALGKNSMDLVYGGAQVGLMGAIADAALQAGSRVTGVIPEYLDRPEIAHEALSEKVVVSDLLDRKKKMLSLADVVVAAPGGVGTIDEVTEVIALKQLSEHNKPIVFFNFLGFWNPLLEYFEILHQQHMISQDMESLFQVIESTEEIIEALDSYRSTDL